LAYSKIADCIETVERDGIHREMHIRDGVPVIKNEISDKITKGDKIHFLDGRKEDAYEIIQDVITKYDGYAPRYVLEGALLYGQLELTPKRTYNIIVSTRLYVNI
jgi:hypothetical protein